MLVVYSSLAEYFDNDLGIAAEGWGRINSETTFVSRMITQPRPNSYVNRGSFDSRVTNWPARGDFEINSPKGFEYVANGLNQIRSGLWLCESGRRCIQFVLQNLARLLLHGTAMLRGANAELALGAFFEPADGDASHDSMIALIAMIAKSDCTLQKSDCGS